MGKIHKARVFEVTTRLLKNKARLAVLDRDGWKCWYCGVDVISYPKSEGIKPNSAVLDHRQSGNDGGKTCLSNLVAACWKCNATKGKKSLEAYRIYCKYFINPTGQAIAHLISSLDAPDLPNREIIKETIKLLEERLGEIAFYGEVVSEK